MLAQSAIRTHHQLDTVFQRNHGLCTSSAFRIRRMTLKNFPHQQLESPVFDYPESSSHRTYGCSSPASHVHSDTNRRGIEVKIFNRVDEQAIFCRSSAATPTRYRRVSVASSGQSPVASAKSLPQSRISTPITWRHLTPQGSRIKPHKQCSFKYSLGRASAR